MLTTRVQPPLKGFDYRIDAFVRLQYNFDGVVNLLDGIAQQVNQRTNKQIITPSQRTVSEISNQLNNNSVTNGVNSIGNQTINLDIQGFAPQTIDQEEILTTANSSTYEEALQDMSI
jgi:hypothetical protein